MSCSDTEADISSAKRCHPRLGRHRATSRSRGVPADLEAQQGCSIGSVRDSSLQLASRQWRTRAQDSKEFASCISPREQSHRGGSVGTIL